MSANIDIRLLAKIRIHHLKWCLKDHVVLRMKILVSYKNNLSPPRFLFTIVVIGSKVTTVALVVTMSMTVMMKTSKKNNHHHRKKHMKIKTRVLMRNSSRIAIPLTKLNIKYSLKTKNFPEKLMSRLSVYSTS